MFAAAAPVNHIWYFWLGVVLAGASILAVVATVALYFVKVTKTRYPQK